MPARISSQTKYACIKSLEEGYSIREITQVSGVSRISIYKWRTAYLKNGVIGRSVKKTASTKDKKLKLLEHKLCKTAITYPSYSIRKLSAMTGMSTSAAWKVLSKHNLSTLKQRSFKHNESIKRSRRLSGTEKLSLINSIRQGESISSLCMKNNISRTTFYTIYNKHAVSTGTLTSVAMLPAYPKGKDHYRYKKGIDRKILHEVLKQPDFSLRQLTYQVNKHTTISVSFVYDVLRRHELHTATARNAYKSSNKFIVIHDLRMLKNEYLGNMQPGVEFIPRIPARMVKEFAYGMAFPVGVAGCIALYVVSSHTVVPLIAQKTDYIAKLTAALSASLQDSQQHGFEKENLPAVTAFSTELPIYKEDTSQQSGSWGAIAVNTNQAVYLPSEKVQLGYTILDAAGNGICEPGAMLTITDPGGRKSIYSTVAGNLVTSPECGYRTLSTAFDHGASYIPVKEGKYDIALNVGGSESARTAKTSFFVTDTVPATVEREAATRIWPRADYPMAIRIKARTAMEGEVREVLPEGFTVRKSNNFTIEEKAGKQVLSWRIALQPGEEKVLTYEFDAPDTSPAFFSIQPLSIWDNSGNLVIKEPRSWQMAIDSL
jgi:transposase